MVKNPVDSAGDSRNTGLARSPGVANGNLLQYSCLENCMDRGAWWATVHRTIKELDTTHRLNNFPLQCLQRPLLKILASWEVKKVKCKREMVTGVSLFIIECMSKGAFRAERRYIKSWHSPGWLSLISPWPEVHDMHMPKPIMDGINHHIWLRLIKLFFFFQ